MQIITGYTGKPHVTAEHDRDINIGLFGAESYVLPTGMMMEAEISSNNEIKIRDGVLMHQGCAGSIKKNTYDSVTITNGSQGMKRIDLIVVRYEKNEDTETEELKWVALQGIPSEDAPEIPDYTQGDIQAGDYVADMPMYEVTIDGLNITQIKKVFETTESLTELNGNIEWKYLGTTAGKTQLNLPSGWKEVMFLVRNSSNHFTHTLAKDMIRLEPDIYVRDGFYYENSGAMFVTRVNSSFIAIYAATTTTNGIMSDVSDSTRLYVWYR